jgi:hypothetical protein
LNTVIRRSYLPAKRASGGAAGSSTGTEAGHLSRNCIAIRA